MRRLVVKRQGKHFNYPKKSFSKGVEHEVNKMTWVLEVVRFITDKKNHEMKKSRNVSNTKQKKVLAQRAKSRTDLSV